MIKEMTCCIDLNNPIFTISVEANWFLIKRENSIIEFKQQLLSSDQGIFNSETTYGEKLILLPSSIIDKTNPINKEIIYKDKIGFVNCYLTKNGDFKFIITLAYKETDESKVINLKYETVPLFINENIKKYVINLLYGNTDIYKDPFVEEFFKLQISVER
jgi:hypothetical protein